jgi:hypothetical protein
MIMTQAPVVFGRAVNVFIAYGAHFLRCSRVIKLVISPSNLEGEVGNVCVQFLSSICVMTAVL